MYISVERTTNNYMILKEVFSFSGGNPERFTVEAEKTTAWSLLRPMRNFLGAAAAREVLECRRRRRRGRGGKGGRRGLLDNGLDPARSDLMRSQ